MSIITRTNRATRARAKVTTSYLSVGGTGGTAALVNNAAAGYSGTRFNRVTWSVATTAVSGGVSYTQTGLAASTTYSHQLYVRSSKVQNMQLVAQYRNASNANVGAAIAGPVVTVVAGNWTRLTVTGASGLLVTNVVLTAQAAAGGTNWDIGDMLDVDAVCIETGSTPGPYFDGAFTDGLGVIYSWAGTADASNSYAKEYIPVITLVPKLDAPTDRVEITVSDLTPNDNVVNLWRTADGERTAVAGARGWAVNVSNAITDSTPPLGRTITYDLEVISGLSAGVATPSATTVLDATHGWLQDPLVPSSAIALYGDVGPNGEPGLDDTSVKSIEHDSSITMLEILGSPRPIALIGQRQAGSNVTFDLTTDNAVQSGILRDLLMQAAPILIRTMPDWAAGLPSLCYLAVPKQVELPQNEAWGGTVIHWTLNGDLVAAPSGAVLVDVNTYTTVAALWDTYQQAQSTLAGKKYLDVLKSPSGI